MESKSKFITFAVITILVLWWFYSRGSDSSVGSFGSPSYDEIIESGPYQDLQAELEDTKAELQEAHDCIDQLHNQLSEIQSDASWAQDSSYSEMNDALWDIDNKAGSPECGY